MTGSNYRLSFRPLQVIEKQERDEVKRINLIKSEVSQEWLEHLFIFLVQNKNSPKVVFAETFPEAFLPIPELTLHSISVVQITSIKGGGRVSLFSTE